MEKEKLTLAEIIWTASVVWNKNMDYEKAMYSDYLYGNEGQIDEVWEYVEELDELGSKAFYEKYKEYKLY